VSRGLWGPRNDESEVALRPRDLALLLLASEELRPRRRRRSQGPDAAGLELKRRLLEAVARVDPEPAGLEAALAGLIDDLGPPSGPIRALALGFKEEWQAVPANPAWLEQLRAQATASEERGDGLGRQLPP
jgi:hypothetical protein